LTFNGCQTAISQLWDWSWTYKSLNINNCQVGIDMTGGGTTAATVGSMVVLDSTFSNTPIAIKTTYTSNIVPATANSLIVENVRLNNVPIAVMNNGATALTGGTTTITGWGQGHKYTPNGPQTWSGTITPATRPAALVSNGKYYERAKPQYNSLPVTSFKSARAAGAKGDGKTDDTTSLQNVITSAASAGQVVFIDAGTYRVTKTIVIPPGSKIVGEAFPVIMSSGSFFNDKNNPKPLFQIGSTSGQAGQVELSDLLLSTQGAQAGAKLIEYNLASSATNPSGLWDVHVRVGGFTGSNLQVAQCLKKPGNSNVDTNCIGAYMLMHITKQSAGLFMENNWLWTADHDFDDGANTQITVYSGRGLLVESTNGPIWLSGSGVEHNVLYQYQVSNANNVYMGFIQTETPYYQPSPNALTPFPPVSSLSDPDFKTSCSGQSGNCAAAWGLRVLNSKNVLVYGAGHYSFFNNYDTTCSAQNGPENCQNQIVSIEGTVSNVRLYSLATIGSINMISRDGKTVAKAADNQNTFPQVIAMYTP
jgi:glucan 1,3-beta-glucosidase